MALLGISLIVASVVLFCLRRPAWLPAFLGWSSAPPRLPPPPPRRQPSPSEPIPLHKRLDANGTTTTTPPPPVIIRETPPGPPSPDSAASVLNEEEQNTPKAAAAVDTAYPAVPSFSLSAPEFNLMPPPPSPAPSLMPPPPLPRSQPTGAYAAGSSTLPRANLPLPNRGGLTLPNRGPPGLTPPPTHSSKPKKPSKEVALAPGHSPLDWARLSGPGADLRNLGPNAPYLRVTPSMLKHYTGRKGKDAWMVLGGKVYNITPYIAFHPGGEPELLRGAGRDGTKLFGEIHPWVNYEGMLSACLVGICVSEEEAKGGMEDMD
ncbi:hypothetical protein OQA88_1364 [Cercophora sp. LCS_1]